MRKNLKKSRPENDHHSLADYGKCCLKGEIGDAGAERKPWLLERALVRDLLVKHFTSLGVRLQGWKLLARWLSSWQACSWLDGSGDLGVSLEQGPH
jgi:hypothetical protein